MIGQAQKRPPFATRCEPSRRLIVVWISKSKPPGPRPSKPRETDPADHRWSPNRIARLYSMWVKPRTGRKPCAIISSVVCNGRRKRLAGGPPAVPHVNDVADDPHDINVVTLNSQRHLDLRTVRLVVPGLVHSPVPFLEGASGAEFGHGIRSGFSGSRRSGRPGWS